jgi:hypothetical protein
MEQTTRRGFLKKGMLLVGGLVGMIAGTGCENQGARDYNETKAYVKTHDTALDDGIRNAYDLLSKDPKALSEWLRLYNENKTDILSRYGGIEGVRQIMPWIGNEEDLRPIDKGALTKKAWTDSDRWKETGKGVGRFLRGF